MTYYWIGGGSPANWSDGTHWSNTSGGSAVNSVPTSSDDVVFDNNSSSGPFTVNIDATANCRDFTVSINNSGRKLTLARSAAVDLSVYGSWSNAASSYFAWSGTSGTLIFKSTATGKTFTTNGVSVPTSVTFDGVGGGWTLGGALTLGTASTNLSILNGAFSLGGFSLNVYATSSLIVSSGSGTCSLDATGSPTISLSSGWSITNSNFSFTKGTSQITMIAASPVFYGMGLSYHNVSMTATSLSTPSITGANTFNNLTFAARSASGIGTLTLSADQTISGTLSAQSGATDPTRRLLVTSDTLGTTRTLTCAAISAACLDLRDITIAGAAATYDASAAYFGNCGGNSGVTFPSPKTVYWGTLAGSSNWYANGWATSSGGSGANANFPLVQDTAVIDESSACTQLNFGGSIWPVGTIDCSARTTTTMTLAESGQGIHFYGGLTLSSKVSTFGTINVTFYGRGTQVITSAGKTITWPLTVSAVGGTVRFGDNATVSATAGVTLTNGTLDINGKTVSVVAFTSSGSATRVLAHGTSGTLTVTGSGASAFVASGSGMTTSGTGKIGLSSASAKTFDGGGFSYGCSVSQEGAGALTIASSNTLADISNTSAGYGSTVSITSGTTQTVSAFTLSGTTGNRITLTATGGTAATLSKASGTVNVTSLNIGKSTATGGATWNAPLTSDNVDNGTNTGWLFPNSYNSSLTESGTAADTPSVIATLVAAASTVATSAETLSGLLAIASALTESGSAAEALHVLLEVSHSEAGTAAETLTPSLRISKAIQEAASPSETPGDVLLAAGGRTESAAFSDTAIPYVVVNSSRGESGTLSEVLTVSNRVSSIVDESVISTATQSNLGAFVGSRTEVGNAVATLANSLAAVAAMLERSPIQEEQFKSLVSDILGSDLLSEYRRRGKR